MTSEFMNILKNVGESISQVAPGLKNVLPEMGAELGRWAFKDRPNWRP